MGIADETKELAITREGHTYINSLTPIENREDFIYIFEVNVFDETCGIYLELDLMYTEYCKN